MVKKVFWSEGNFKGVKKCLFFSVSKAAKLLCDRRLHRLVILDPEKGGNPLFLLTKKDILKALRKYVSAYSFFGNRFFKSYIFGACLKLLFSAKVLIDLFLFQIAKLPLPACMDKTLDDLALGTWSDLVTVTPGTTLHEALSLFLSKGVSALPVVNERFQIIDVLTKVDVLNLVIENKGFVDGILKMTVEDATKNRTAVSAVSIGWKFESASLL